MTQDIRADLILEALTEDEISPLDACQLYESALIDMIATLPKIEGVSPGRRLVIYFEILRVFLSELVVRDGHETFDEFMNTVLLNPVQMMTLSRNIARKLDQNGVI
jgi:hypothetical protein